MDGNLRREMGATWMRALAIAGALLITTPAFADYAEVPGTPRVQFNAKTYGVWAIESGVGTGISLFEKQPNGTWLGAGGCTAFDYDADSEIARAGSALARLKEEIPLFNQCLAKFFGTISPTNAVGKLNSALSQSCGFNSANVLLCQ